MSSNDDAIVYAHLPGLLAVGQVLVLHRSPGLLLCLICEQWEPRLQCVEPLTVEEERALISLIRAFTAYALVLASIENGTVEEAQNQLDIAWLQGKAAHAACAHGVEGASLQAA